MSNSRLTKEQMQEAVNLVAKHGTVSERVGPFLVPDDRGGVSLIHNNERIPLDHTSAEHWWWTLSEYMKRWAEEKRKNG